MSKTYLFLTFFFVIIQALFAFFEMAAVSFHKIRLQYYTSLRLKRALWLDHLIRNPSQLFGTTLIGITSSLIIGSECARRLYESMGLDPDFSPLTQVPFVLIFGELVPMFAARRHPEQAAMFCIPFMMLLSKLLAPLTWSFNALSKLLHIMMGKHLENPLFLTREEVRMAFEEKEIGVGEFDQVVGNIFQIKNQTAFDLMTPLERVKMVSSQSHLSDVKKLLSSRDTFILPVYHRDPKNIVGIAGLKELLNLEENQRVMNQARSPWFVTKDTPVMKLLEQFKQNNQSVAVILDAAGQGLGILTLDQILQQIFGGNVQEKLPLDFLHHIERTISADMDLEEFNRQFGSSFPEEEKTIGHFVLSHLRHLPVKGERIKIENFVFVVEELTMRGMKTLLVIRR